MNRRKALALVGCASMPVVLPSVPANTIHSKWLPLFAERWQVNESHTFEVLDAMPDDMLDFEPTSEMMTYGKLP